MIRKCTEEDRDAIRELLDGAFRPSQYESRLRDLIVSGDETHEEWLVENASRIVGHILYTLAIDGSSAIGYHLAPIAIHPDFQNQGIGTRLIRETLEKEPIINESIFVLGDPQFYERFGFVKPASPSCPYDEGNKHFRALRWNDSREPFVIGYTSAFEQAEQDVDPNACPAESSIRHDHSIFNPEVGARPRSGVG
jgi:putative acetyltransferase